MALRWPSQTQLPVLIEILLNGTWTNITRYCYLRDGITITGGAPDESSRPQPGQLTLTLNNRDGRFTPRYTSGAYYPYLTRNTQIRVSVDVTSVSGARYSGFRFWGEVPDWPPQWDVSGQDVYVQVTASGPLRRVNQGGGQGSALVRYYASLNATYAPIAYWPCEEDPQTSQIQTGQPGGNVMTVTGSPQWKAISNFNGSAPIGVLNGSTWDGLTGQAAWSGDDVYTSAGNKVWTCPPGITAVNCKVWGPGDDGADLAGTGGAGGGGGEFAQETALAVTPGKDYAFRVHAGGSQNDQVFAGDSVTVTGHAGVGTAGGSGSTNAAHHNGGNGGTGSAAGAGGGGGGSGGTAAAGNNGGNASGTTGGTGGAAVTGGGKGGDGGSSGFLVVPPVQGAVPGGGGGGGAAGVGGSPVGANGGNGKVELIYTPPSVPLANVFRFILFVPAHGGNNGKILARMLTGGTIARVDVIYSTVATVPKLQLKGYDSGNNLKFDSGAQTFPLLGLTFMVSAELTTSGSSVAWKLTGIVPGEDDVFATYTGTVATASLGNVTEVIVAPNADITKTAMGHFSVQYAVVPLQKVSKALHGHHTEMSIDRFLRLANEQAMAAEPGWNETADHWGFEGWTTTCQGTPLDNEYFIVAAVTVPEIAVGDRFTSSLTGATVFTVTSISAIFAGFANIHFYPDAASVLSNPATVTTSPAPGVQGWTGSNGSVAQSAVTVASDDLTQLNSAELKWPSHGTHSLLLTATGGAGAWSAASPSGTSGQPVLPGDRVSVHADIYTPAALAAVRSKISWWKSDGTANGTTTAAARATTAGQVTTLKLTGTAPASTATFNIIVEDNETKTAGTLLYIDNVRVHPRMGPQTRRELKHFLQEIKDLDQGILKESRKLFGLGYRTRISILNQTPKLTLDYSAGQISPPLQPVTDDLHTKNHITVHRHKGGKVTVSLGGGGMGTGAPPDGAGQYKKWLRAVAEADEQLAALASHLLTLGTWNGERYPTVTVNLVRAQMASLVPTAAEVEIGDYVQLTNLPFFTPAATAKQIVTGYTEYLNVKEWTITFSCVPEDPLEMITLRRW